MCCEIDEEGIEGRGFSGEDVNAVESERIGDIAVVIHLVEIL